MRIPDSNFIYLPNEITFSSVFNLRSLCVCFFVFSKKTYNLIRGIENMTFIGYFALTLILT